MSPRLGEARRLEELWSGHFGDDYVDRNSDFAHRRGFWHMISSELACRRVLEVGCNVGGNLQWIAERLPPQGQCVGADVNAKALEQLRARLPSVHAVRVPAQELPWRDGQFDLVFTMGVLIHQPATTLPRAMAEMVRCSNRFVLCGEYYADDPEPVEYRGVEGALFKRDYGRMFLERFPNLALRRQGFLARADGWDDVTWWLFEKGAGGAVPSG